MHKNKLFKEISSKPKYYWGCWNLLFLVIIFFLPIILFPYMMKNIHEKLTFYCFFLSLFSIPLSCFFFIKKLRNPFFIIPFALTFLVAELSDSLLNFIQNSFFYLVLFPCLFMIFRTPGRLRYIFIDYLFYKIGYFTTYFEVRRYWRTLILGLCPFFIPVLWSLHLFLT